MLDQLGTYLPATVIAAIILFLMREVFEGWRRWRARKRKVYALRQILGRECELNLWTSRRLKEAIKDAQEAITSQPPGRFEIVEKPDGSEHWHWFDGEGDDHGGALLPPVYRKVMDDRALDIAELDPKLFKQFEEAVTAVAELSHLRGSLVNYANTDDDIEAHFFEGFTEWALEQFDDIEAELGKLYWACTGNELTKPRLR